MELKQEFTSLVLEESNLPIISINNKGEVIFWSKGAEGLLGYKKDEVLNETKNFITTDNDEEELLLILKKAAKNENFLYKTQQAHKKGYNINLLVNIFPVIQNSALVGVSAIVQDNSVIKKATLLNSSDIQRDTKRTFKVIRNTILSYLVKGKMTINQVSNGTGINWKTVEKHLTFLIGRKMIEEVFSSEYVRIFELTAKGKEYINNLQKEKLTDFFKIKEVKE